VDESDSEFDIAWKQALEWFFEPFLAFFFPVAHADIDWNREPVFMDKELQQIVPGAVSGRGTVDKLVQVWTSAGEEAWVLIHVEVQSQQDASFAERMFGYNYRLRDKYGRMPVSLAILGDESRSWRPSRFESGRWDCEVRFTFPAVKLVDYSGRDSVLEADTNPFAAVTLAHLKANETRGDATARYDWKLRLVKGLYDRGFSKLQIGRLFNVIDWVIKLPPVSRKMFSQEVDRYEKEKSVEPICPTFQMFRDEGLAEGRNEGHARGRTEALAESLSTVHAAIGVCLKLRFGSPGVELMPQVRSVKEHAALEAFLRAIETAPDLDTLRDLLIPHADPTE